MKRLAPDVLVMDIAMPRLNGIQTIKQVRALGAETQVVVPNQVVQAPESGSSSLGDCG